MKRLSFAIFLFLFSTKIFADYKSQAPFFYAALAEASYTKNVRQSQMILDRLLGKGEVKVHRVVKVPTALRASTMVILVEDKMNQFHVGFEGSNDLGDWLGNIIINPTRGTFYEYDVTKGADQRMHNLMMSWKRQVGGLTSIVGHSRGGMYASQVPHKHGADYENTQIITFNALKPKARGNQLHLAVKSERASTILSSNGRYKRLNIGRGAWRLYSNHKMKYFLSGLRGQSWDFIPQ